MSKELQLFIFTVISVITVAIGLILAKKHVKSERGKDLLFIIVAVITVLIHFTSVFVSVIKGEPIELLDTYYLPVYPCNIIMWQNLVIALLIAFRWKGKVLNVLANGTFFIGTVCAFVGIALNENFLSNPSFTDLDILKGLLSHVTLLFCSLYVFVGKFFSVTGLKNFMPLVIQALIFGLCGVYTNKVKAILGHNDVNSMFMERPPFENLPFINVYTCVPVILLIFFVIFLVIEKKKTSKTNKKEK